MSMLVIIQVAILSVTLYGFGGWCRLLAGSKILEGVDGIPNIRIFLK